MKIELSDYPLITSILEENQKDRLYQGFVSILEKINETIENQEILNPDFNDVKYYINRIVSETFNKAISSKYTHAGKYESLPEELQYMSIPYELRNVNAYYKKLDKMKEYKDEQFVQDSLKLCKEFIDLIEGYNFMKSKVVKVTDKRKKEKLLEQEQEDLWHKNLVSHKDVKTVLALLDNEAKNIHDKLMQSHLEEVLQVIDTFKKKSLEGNTNYREYTKKDIFALITLQQLTERKGTYYKPEYVLVSNYAQKAEEMSDKYAQDIVNRFTYKNTHKLGFILTEKNNLKEVSLSNVRLGKGHIECDVNCVFEDNSRFIANTSVVLAYSKYGKPFYRYPTIFREVFLPNGESLTNSSEERMEEIFTKENTKAKLKM